MTEREKLIRAIADDLPSLDKSPECGTEDIARSILETIEAHEGGCRVVPLKATPWQHERGAEVVFDQGKTVRACSVYEAMVIATPFQPPK